MKGMEGVNIVATISDRNVVSNFVGFLPIEQNSSFEEMFYSQTFESLNLNNLNSCAPLGKLSEILRGFAHEKTTNFLESYKIFIPNEENVYIALSLIMNNEPLIQAMAFSVGEDSIFGFEGSSNDLRFSIMPKEKNAELYYSSLINHNHYHEVFGSLKNSVGLLFLRYEKNFLSKKKSGKDYYTHLYRSIANVTKIIFNTLEKVNPVFNVSGDFSMEEFEFEHINQYFVEEAITIDVNVLDFIIAK